MTNYFALLVGIAPRGNVVIMRGVANAMAAYFPQYQIDTPLRQAHFIAQAAMETDGFKTLHEYASGEAYQGRKDLGNTQPGDGKRFKGRGIFQLTGRVNYTAYGKRLGLDLVSNPELAAIPENSVRIACEYWKAKGLNAWADRDDVNEITRRINGGYNGLATRKVYLQRAKAVLCPAGDDPPKFVTPHEEVPDAPIAAEPAKKWWESTEIQAGGAGFMATILAAIQSPYALAAFITVVLGAVAFGAIWFLRMRREQKDKPT